MPTTRTITRIADRLDREGRTGLGKSGSTTTGSRLREEGSRPCASKRLCREKWTRPTWRLDPYAPQKLPVRPNTGFGVVLDGFVGSEEYRRIRIIYALYDGKNPCGGALGRSRATRKCEDG